MATVLVVSTRYDRATRMTYRWARHFVGELNKLGQHPISLYGSAVNAVSLQNPLIKADVLVFFGHGEPDRFIGQRSWLSTGSGPTLVDVSTVAALKHVNVYAVCCQASLLLGKAYAGIAPGGAFLGYAAPFGISYPNAAYFENIVVDRGLDLVLGKITPHTIEIDLRQEWKNLSDQFLNGALHNRPDQFLAGLAAATNSLFVTLTP
jgi:hypothetical protein